MLVVGEASRSWTGARVGEADFCIMFEQLLDARQLVHSLLTLAQTSAFTVTSFTHTLVSTLYAGIIICT